MHGRKGGFVRDSIADIESFRPGSPGWPASIGMGGRLPSESVAGLRRNQWPLCVGLRNLFLRHGGKIILIAQFVPVLRSIAGILAGANRMPWPHFMLTNIIGAFLWATFYGFAAYSLGRQAEQLGGWMVFVLGLGLLTFIVVAAIFIGRHEAQLTAEAEQALPGPLEIP